MEVRFKLFQGDIDRRYFLGSIPSNKCYPISPRLNKNLTLLSISQKCIVDGRVSSRNLSHLFEYKHPTIFPPLNFFLNCFENNIQNNTKSVMVDGGN